MDNRILIWLPSPLGDAVMCTPALRAIREHFASAEITFFGNEVIRQILTPSDLNDRWLIQSKRGIFELARLLRKNRFTQAILFKNSIGSALACFLARIPSRTGYAREGRGLLLTERLRPAKLANGNFRPEPMIDYYNAIASWLGCDVQGKEMELQVTQGDIEELKRNLPRLGRDGKDVFILVPGGAFGPSKCWPADRFARTADRLIEKYGGEVVVSVSPTPEEKEIARQICSLSENDPINLSSTPISLRQLKALFSMAKLVITNDTGPRHIAIALNRKVVTLFGPNDPAWTETGWQNEIKLVGKVPCGPCAKPACKEDKHFCMEAITVEMACEAAEKLLAGEPAKVT